MVFTVRFDNNVNEVLEQIKLLGLTVVATDKNKILARADNDDQIVAFLESGL